MNTSVFHYYFIIVNSKYKIAVRSQKMIEGKQKMLKKVPYFDFHYLLLLKYKNMDIKKTLSTWQNL